MTGSNRVSAKSGNVVWFVTLSVTLLHHQPSLMDIVGPMLLSLGMLLNKSGASYMSRLRIEQMLYDHLWSTVCQRWVLPQALQRQAIEVYILPS